MSSKRASLMTSSLVYQGLALLGALTLSHLLLRQVFNLLRGIRVYILSRWWRKDLKQYGGWAVVTGASDGIGKCYAEELARRGFDVVLISRTQEKLEKVAKEIERQTGRKTRIIQVDFTGGLEIYTKIEEGLRDLDIGILVNNVAVIPTGNNAVPFLNAPHLEQAICDMVNCNMLSVAQMTRIVLPKMLARKKGLIVNLSSAAGFRPFRYFTVYSATKAFVDYFSRALHAEYKTRGITVQCVMPMIVSTNMTDNIRSTLFVKRAEDFAREALNTAGLTNRAMGCLMHAIQSHVLFTLPEVVINSRLFELLDEEYQKKVGERPKPKSQ
ncbi:very-long-chain 3-oxoacyl-CoA reductase-B-like isoform X2 [Hyperolius riggenbachi]|uniref:very-long-chain 3-oxoacyl-CoA reductase-B-like isoform X2 n=1 Tax=Hyperolius riggenbachi TaxID=752182 RepID=UPI0035A291EC